MFEFYWPYFSLLLPIPFLALWLMPRIKSERDNNEQQLLFPNIGYIKEVSESRDSSEQSHSVIYIVLLSLFWVLLVLALMRPQIVDQTEEVEAEGHDILLAVDISPSMQALDFSRQNNLITRLDITKKVVKNFINKRTTDRLGLILFARHAYVQVPLTHDTKHVATMLDNSAVGMAGDSTSIGDTIGVAIKNLREKDEHNRILILLTDGSDNSSIIPPDEAANIAKDNNIKIYTIGIGKKGIVPVQDGYGGIQMIQSDMDEKLLQEIANVTGGYYFKAEDDITLEKIYQKIDQLEKVEYDIKTLQIRTPLFRYPLGVASFIFLLLALAGLLRNVKLRGQYGF